MSDLRDFTSTMMKEEVGKQFISEMKAMKQPPTLIKDLLECVCHLMHAEPTVVGYLQNRSPIIDWWATSTRMMSEVNFFNRLVNYDN